MKKITDFIVDHRYFILTFFIVLAGVCAFLASKVNINRDISFYMPKTSDTSIGKKIMDKEFAQEDKSTLNIMFYNLKEEDKNKIYNDLEEMKGVEEVLYDTTSTYNKDGYTLYVMTIDGDKDSKLAKDIYNDIHKKYENYEIYTGGEVDEENKVILPTWIVGLAIFCALIILVIMCDSYLEPILFLIAIGLAVILNKGTNIMFSSISSITNAIAAILQLALSMDYSIMLINRYRQEKETEKDDVKAMKKALLDSFSSISSSSVTTIVGLLALVFMSFTIGKDLGLVLAKGVLFSLLTIFTCLPALILMFDKWIIKTKKKSPVIKLDFLGRFAYKFRYLGIILFVLILGGSYILKDNLKILYTDSENDKIEQVFKVNNEMAIIYKNEYEELVNDYVKTIEDNPNIDEILGNGNTINEALREEDLKDKLKELGSNTDIEDYLLKIIYYHYYNPKENNKINLEDLVSFIKNNVYNVQDMNAKLSKNDKLNIDKLENFSKKEEITKLRTKKDIASMFNMKEELVDDLEVYYNAKGIKIKLTLPEFVNFMNNYVVKSKYASNLDKNAIASLNLLSNYMDKELISKELTEQEMAKLLGIDENLVNNLYLYYESLSKIDKKLSLNEFSEFMINVVLASDTEDFDEITINKLEMINTLSNLEVINKEINYEEMSALLGEDVNNIKMLYSIVSPNSTVISPYQFVNLILNNPNLVNILQDNSNKLKMANLIMESALNNKSYSYQEIANAFGLEEAQVKNIFTLYLSVNNEIKIKPINLVNFILEHKNEAMLTNIVDKNMEDNLVLLQTVMKSVENQEKYDASNLGNMLNIKMEDMTLLYSLYNIKYQNKEVKMSYQEFAEFLIQDVITNKKYASNLDSEKIAKIKMVNTIINDSLNKKQYTKEELDKNLRVLAPDLDKDLIETLYIYYGSVNNYDNNWKLTVSKFINYLNETILKDKRFDDYIKSDTRKEIIEAQKTVNDAYSKLVGENYSRIVLNTKFNPEDEEVFNFIKDIKTKLNKKDIYVIGNSPMAYEMSLTFQDELNLITVLTIVFIFIVVLVTFKKFLVPVILVLLIQTAVFLTMVILTLEGGSVYFIALLIVQSILMGATIDYAILFTSYYEEFRKNKGIKESLIGAYNSSIHTILTSASILTLVTLVVGYFGSAISAKICITISQGTLCSTLLILFILPMVEGCFDKLIIKK